MILHEWHWVRLKGSRAWKSSFIVCFTFGLKCFGKHASSFIEGRMWFFFKILESKCNFNHPFSQMYWFFGVLVLCFVHESCVWITGFSVSSEPSSMVSSLYCTPFEVTCGTVSLTLSTHHQTILLWHVMAARCTKIVCRRSPLNTQLFKQNGP